MKTNNVIAIDFANVHWFTATNIRRNAKSWGNPIADINFRVEPEFAADGKTVIGEKFADAGTTTDRPLVRLLADGWQAREGVCTVVKATAQQAKEAVADRREQVDKLKLQENMLPMATALEAVWFPNGKAAPVEWIANNCYRRSIGIRGVLTRRRSLDSANWDRIFVVLCESKDFGSGSAGDRAKLVDHILENTRKTAGRKELQPVDYFHQAVELRKIDGASARESDLMRLDIKRGESQRAFALAKFNADFPELNLLARTDESKAPKADSEGKPTAYLYVQCKSYVDVARLRHADVVRLASGYIVGSKGEEGKLSTRKQKLDAIEGYIKAAMTGSKPKTLTIADATEAMGNSPVVLLQAIATRLSRPDAAKFVEVLSPHADRINKALAFLAKEDAIYDEIANPPAEKEAAAKVA